MIPAIDSKAMTEGEIPLADLCPTCAERPHAGREHSGEMLCEVCWEDVVLTYARSFNADEVLP